MGSTKLKASPRQVRQQIRAGSPAEAARALREAPGGPGWARLAKTVSAQDVQESSRLLMALDYALKKTTEDGAACSEVMAAKAKVIAINAEFDAVFEDNVTAGAELDGIENKIHQMEDAAAAAKEALSASRADVKEARELLAAHFEATGDPAAGGVDAAMAESLRVIDELIDGDLLRQTHAQNATLAATTEDAYKDFRANLKDYDKEEDHTTDELQDSNATLLEVVARWRDARDEVKAAEAACEEKTSLWAQRTVRTTVERTAIAAALRALHAGPAAPLSAQPASLVAPRRAGALRR